jgi:predicted negative regulator of RcsB-dependent stress response
MVYENRKGIFVVIIAVLVGAIGYALWNQGQASRARDISVKVFEFQSGTWADAKSGKVQSADLLKSFQGLDEEVKTAPIMVPVALEMSKFLAEKGENEEAAALLNELDGKTKNSLTAFFVTLQRTVILEKMGKIDEAIQSIEALSQKKDVLMPSKVFLELGRLYLVKGEKGKAQTQFEYVVSTYPNNEEAKLAKLYLGQLAQ